MTDTPTNGTPVDEQARAHTATCLKKLTDLLQKDTINSKPVDPRLQFWIARFLIELGHGRAPTRKVPREDTNTLAPDEQNKLEFFMGHYDRLTITHNPEHGEKTGMGESSVPSLLAVYSPRQPDNADG